MFHIPIPINLFRCNTLLKNRRGSFLRWGRQYYQKTSSWEIVHARYRFRPNVSRSINCSSRVFKGLLPGSSDPTSPSNLSPQSVYATTPANLSMEQYHALADSYLSELDEKLQELQEENEAIDVEFSAGVLTLTLPPKGTYVLNKQPPNKQIWLASPITGPKRYDYVIFSEGQDSKQGTGHGEWVYLRDGSTLSKLLKEECQVVMTERSND